jgi:ferredoxin-NADP reductase
VPPTTNRLGWRPAVVAAVRRETKTAVTVVLRVDDWPGHRAGQHVDVRLTAPDGYTASRSYSIASAPVGAGAGDSDRDTARDADLVELTVELVEDGEVSSYLTGDLRPGDRLEVRGPVGGWFVWTPAPPDDRRTDPLQLVAGGSGVVPLMAMLRARAAAGSRTPTRLLYSTRSPESAIYRAELDRLARDDGGPVVTWAWTRAAPPGWDGPVGRVDATLLDRVSWPVADRPVCYVCGPTGFVETVADLLVAAGHDPARIRTERFGPTGGSR